MLSKGTQCLPRRFTDLTYSREENKNNVTRCGFFNPRNSNFLVFYKKFDWIILKIWSLVLCSKSVRETYGRLKERSVNRQGRRRVPIDDTMVLSKHVYLPNEPTSQALQYFVNKIHAENKVFPKTLKRKKTCIQTNLLVASRSRRLYILYSSSFFLLLH